MGEAKAIEFDPLSSFIRVYDSYGAKLSKYCGNDWVVSRCIVPLCGGRGVHPYCVQLINHRDVAGKFLELPAVIPSSRLLKSMRNRLAEIAAPSTINRIHVSSRFAVVLCLLEVITKSNLESRQECDGYVDIPGVVIDNIECTIRVVQSGVDLYQIFDCNGNDITKQS